MMGAGGKGREGAQISSHSGPLIPRDRMLLVVSPAKNHDVSAKERLGTVREGKARTEAIFRGCMFNDPNCPPAGFPSGSQAFCH